MDTANEFRFKQRKYMPVFPKAIGKPTFYIEGYPYEDDEPMPAGGIHAVQTHNLFDQFFRYFQEHPHIYVATDNFVYYREGDRRKVVAPDVYVVLGAAELPLRQSFYTWAEGIAPTVVFEFLSDSTASEDRGKKVEVYMRDIGVAECFIHQPHIDRPIEFRGWRRDASGDIVEIEAEADGSLFSASLNLYLRWELDAAAEIRLLRPYLPDGTPIPTSLEERRMKEAAEARAETAETRAVEAERRRQQAEAELAELRAQMAQSQRE